MTKVIKSANGLNGCLIYCGDGNYRIRLYRDETFVDCKIAHCDLSIVIQDEDAYLYEDNDGTVWLDHSPETLGLSNEK
jgi:hypothetical protein